jgi:hypothetical protein
MRAYAHNYALNQLEVINIGRPPPFTSELVGGNW